MAELTGPTNVTRGGDHSSEADLQKKRIMPKEKSRIGDLMLRSGYIDEEQLTQALQRQQQVGGQLGSIFIEMGFITIDQLLDFLSKQLGVPGVNLFKMDIDQDVVRLIPLSKIKSLRILPISSKGNSLTLAMVNPKNITTISEIEFTLGKKVQSVVVPSFMMDAAIKSLFSKAADGLKGDVLCKVAETDKIGRSPRLDTLLQQLIESKASDMFLTAGVPPSIKIGHDVIRLPMIPLTPGCCAKYAKEIMGEQEWENFVKTNEHDFGVTFPDIGRFRVNVYRQRNSVSVAMRYIPDEVGTFQQLNLPEWVKTYALKPQGLILITGPSGHGKSTTLAAMVDLINSERKLNIVTLEDPVEYLHKHKKSNVNQREVGRDTESFHEGLKRVFRQAPDVIVIGEMRDMVSFEIALKVASTGHLVLSTLHGDNSTTVIERIINMFEPYRQNLIRTMISESLLLVLAQRLLSRRSGPGRIMALEKLTNSNRIAGMIRDQKTYQIRSQLQVACDDFESLDCSISHLIKAGLVSWEEGSKYMEDLAFCSRLSARG
ncbi:MAG: PilT/PilU family type 4a pilus ATPase [Pseudomonadota bacterium]